LLCISPVGRNPSVGRKADPSCPVWVGTCRQPPVRRTSAKGQEADLCRQASVGSSRPKADLDAPSSGRQESARQPTLTSVSQNGRIRPTANVADDCGCALARRSGRRVRRGSEGSDEAGLPGRRSALRRRGHARTRALSADKRGCRAFNGLRRQLSAALPTSPPAAWPHTMPMP